MRGYFAVGVDGISKPMNLGNLLRISHAFGASFFFTVAGRVKLADAMSDTSAAAGHVPLYQFSGVDDLRLPQGCEIVAVEIERQGGAWIMNAGTSTAHLMTPGE